MEETYVDRIGLHCCFLNLTGDNMKKEAKMDVLKALQKMATDMMGEDMKKVSVMAKDNKGLEEGLDKAKEIIGDMDEEEEDDKE